MTDLVAFAAQVPGLVGDESSMPVAPLKFGVNFSAVNDQVATLLHMPSAAGVIVTLVTAGSPAASAGIVRGDVILKFGDATISSAEGLQQQVALQAKGSLVHILLWRAGAETQVDVQF